jgi:hypothetical protein
MRLCLTRKDLGDADAVGVARRLAAREQLPDLRRKARRHDLVGIDVEQPHVPALLFGEALLRPVARPRIEDHARAERLGQCLRAVGRPRIDDDEVIGEVADGPDRLAKAVGLIDRDDEHG